MIVPIEADERTLEKALDKADANGYIIVDMKKDWKTIFPFKEKTK